MTLSLRLRTLCSLLDTDETGGLIDVGYDHGQLLHWAAEHQMAPLYGIEKSEHFKLRYQQTYPHDKVTLFTGDGLHAFPKSLCAATVVLAGIGEQQIRRILDENTRVWEHSRRIIFSPSSIDLKLRHYLNNSGWYMQDELIVQERNKLYVLSIAVPGVESCTDEVACAIGPRLYAKQDPLLEAYLAFVDKRLKGSKRQ